MEFNLQTKTILFTIGPSNCGKSFLTKQLKEKLKSQGYKTELFSSDETRRLLLDKDELHKHNEEMMLVSKQAFNLIYANVKNYTEYPVNYDFIIVDATHLSEMARKPLLDLAKQNGYNIVPIIFDYKDKYDYFKFVEEDEKINKNVVDGMVTQHRKSLKELNLKSYSNAFRIYNIVDDLTVNISEENPNEYKVIDYEKVAVIGDIHGQKDSLVELLNKIDGVESTSTEIIKNEEGYKMILVGDYLDKGTLEEIKDTIDFIHSNQEHFVIVKGNHERHCHGVLTKQIKRDKNEEVLINDYFNSVLLFDVDEDAKQKFLEIYSKSFHFVKDLKNRFIVTHAPCEIKYLGKTDNFSLKQQNTIRYPKFDKENVVASLQEREDFLDFIRKEAEGNQPYHVFGHIAVSEIFKYKNKINVDTGCYKTGQLSAVLFNGKNKPYMTKTPVKTECSELFPLFRNKEVIRSVESIDEDALKYLKYAAKDSVAFISGTMSPTNKDSEKEILESLDKGLEYYQKVGVEKVILQVKQMGSRCNAYIHKTDVKKCKLVSRNGYVIRPKTLGMTLEEYEAFLIKIQNKYNPVFEKLKATFILFDGELLPWNKMAGSLIDKDFRTPYVLANFENEILNESGFYDLLEEYLKVDPENLVDYHKKSQAKLIEFENINRSYSENKLMLDAYSKEVEHFAREYDVDFSAFSILKIIDDSGERNLLQTNEMSNIDVYKLLGNDTYFIYDLKNPENNICVIDGEKWGHDVYEFYNHVSIKNKEEGVVIKPERMYIPKVAPYLKCRNYNYLRMTYGFDYLLNEKYKSLVNGKNIKRKLETSIYEWELIRELLNISINNISLQNDQYVSLMGKLHGAVASEKNLDPRL